MRIGIIDCGTNMFNLLVAEATPEQWQVVFQNKLSVKLGSGGFAEGRILPVRMNRGLDAMRIHVQNAHNYGCEKIVAMATSAVRGAKNGEEFVAKAKSLTQVQVEIIDGDREAELIYLGVRQAAALGDHPVLIMDIGGGSTEFIIANDREIFWKKSYPLGVSRLFDRIRPEDKLTKENIAALRALLDGSLAEVKQKVSEYGCTHLFGCSGSFDTLLSLYLHNAKQNIHAPGIVNDIPVESFPSVYRWLIGSSMEDRLKHPAIPSIRAEYMPLSGFLVKYVLDWGHIARITQSNYALKEGVIRTVMDSIDWSQYPSPPREVES